MESPPRQVTFLHAESLRCLLTKSSGWLVEHSGNRNLLHFVRKDRQDQSTSLIPIDTSRLTRGMLPSDNLFIHEFLEVIDNSRHGDSDVL